MEGSLQMMEPRVTLLCRIPFAREIGNVYLISFVHDPRFESLKILGRVLGFRSDRLGRDGSHAE